MKFLFPSTTIILVSHMKPFLRDALNSVVRQTRTDLQCIVADSGQWVEREGERASQMKAIYDDFAQHPMIEWVFTGEPPDLVNHCCPIGLVTNEVIRAGIIRGKYVCNFYDDDFYEPQFVEVMAGFLDAHPEHRAVWCSQYMAASLWDGVSQIGGVRMASAPKYGETLDCQVDGGQVMYRKDVLDEIGDPWLPEDNANCGHSDGVFLNKVGRVCGVVANIEQILCTNRKTPLSAFSPTA